MSKYNTRASTKSLVLRDFISVGNEENETGVRVRTTILPTKLVLTKDSGDRTTLYIGSDAKFKVDPSDNRQVLITGFVSDDAGMSEGVVQQFTAIESFSVANKDPTEGSEVSFAVDINDDAAFYSVPCSNPVYAASRLQ